MLDANALAALKSLKSTIQDSKQLFTGVVKGSANRFGFVIRDDDAQEFFLPPAEMDKVLAGDHIEFELLKNDKDREYGEVTKLLNSPLKTFVGQYVVKGNAHLAVPDDPMQNKAFFIPPKERKGNKNDFLSCKVTRHPFPDGKAQAKTLKVIGNKGSDFIEHDYTRARFGLDIEFPLQVSNAVDNLSEELLQQEATGRTDHTEVAFVTIDNEATRDMDDALWAAETEDGFKVRVAIADPTPWFAENSLIDKEACRRTTSTYLPGQTITMLPPRLAHNLCSLVPGFSRLALVLSMDISPEGEVRNALFESSVIRSHAKLSYSQVTTMLESGDFQGQPEAVSTSLQALNKACSVLNRVRAREALPMEDRPDYYYNLDEHGKLLSISRADRILAQGIVEEFMLLTNRQAAAFLQQHQTGLFINQPGLRPEKQDEVRQILQSCEIDPDQSDWQTLEGFVGLIKVLDKRHPKARQIIGRMYNRSEVSRECLGHFAQGFKAYTTITSPIRKYIDLCNHRRIREILSGNTPTAADDTQLEAIRNGLQVSRQAASQVESWLTCLYMENFNGIEFEAEITYVNGIGFGVRLPHNGVEGFVDLRTLNVKSDFDGVWMAHRIAGQTYQLGDLITVRANGFNMERKQVQFKAEFPEATTSTNAGN